MSGRRHPDAHDPQLTEQDLAIAPLVGRYVRVVRSASGSARRSWLQAPTSRLGGSGTSTSEELQSAVAWSFADFSNFVEPYNGSRRLRLLLRQRTSTLVIRHLF